MYSTLKFRPDGAFKIVQITDVHWESMGESLDECDKKSRLVMEKILDIEKPDLVVLTGDMMTSGRKSPIQQARTLKCVEDALKIILKPILERNILWTYTLGNHDHCHQISVPYIIKALLRLPGCVMKPGGKDSGGMGNYKLDIKSNLDRKTKWNLYAFDSGCKYDYPKKSYGWVRREQINWYVKQSKKATKRNGKIIPSLVFFHIPLPEYKEVWDTQVCYGTKGERISCPVLNTGLFSEMVQSRNVKGVFVGHDHRNDFNGNLHGIELCYGRTTGYRMHQDNFFTLGARVIELNEQQEEFQTWIRLEDGSILQPDMHDPSE